MKHRAVREGDYKLVGEAGGPWRLYNVGQDRIESRDLSRNPGQAARVNRLSRLYDEWATEVGAPSAADCEKARPMGMKNYVKELAKVEE